MRKLLFILMSGLLLTACAISGEEVPVEDGSKDAVVKKLFTVDGVTVYRFCDGAEYVYFTNSSGMVKYQTEDDEGNITVHRTLCNGKIEAKDSKN